MILVGATENDIEQIHIKNREKLITFSAEELRSGRGKDKLSKIMTDVPFYISIDKDILDKNYIETKIGYLKEQIESEQIDEILRG